MVRATRARIEEPCSSIVCAGDTLYQLLLLSVKPMHQHDPPAPSRATMHTELQGK